MGLIVCFLCMKIGKEMQYESRFDLAFLKRFSVESDLSIVITTLSFSICCNDRSVNYFSANIS